jgi:Ca-activated chloride channel family protein
MSKAGAMGSGGLIGSGGVFSVSPSSGGSPGSGGTTSTGGTSVPSSGDKYQPVGTNPFVMTAHDPFSTFAADVDTASYDLFRRDAGQGLLPAAASVRLEEYVNYFSYNYPAPAADSPYPFQVSLAAANKVFARGTALLRVGVQATLPPPYVKKPTNLVFLLDVSGSMSDTNKLPLVKELVLATLDQLDASDHVSIVTYSTTAQVVLAPTSMELRSTIAAAVSALQANGSTAGADGLGLAYAQAMAGFITGGINHIVLCTDGDFNVGPSSTSDLLNLIREKRKTGVTLTVLGFGSGNLNDAMMESVADAGNGIYSVIIDSASAKTYAQTKILSTITHVAKDMKIQVEFNPDLVVAYRLLGYEDRGIADQSFRDDTVDAGEVGAGHRVTALYEMVLTGQTVPVAASAPVPDDGEPSPLPREVSASDFVLVKVRYKTVEAIATDPAIEMSTSLPAGLLTEQLSAADADMQWAVAVAALAEILKTSPYADKTLVPSIRAIAAAQASRDADRAEFATLLEKIATKL